MLNELVEAFKQIEAALSVALLLQPVRQLELDDSRKQIVHEIVLAAHEDLCQTVYCSSLHLLRMVLFEEGEHERL